MKQLNRRGFTIIELLIATVVFSVILLVITAAIVQFGKLYYRGIIQNRVQETARTISEDITQAIQFSGSGSTPLRTYDPVTKRGHICIGDRRYTFQYDRQLGEAPNKHVLVQDQTSGCTGGIDLDSVPAGVTDLMGSGMWLAELDITDAGSELYRVTVRVAYGPEDVLSADKKSCAVNVRVGGQFCAVSDLTTIVTKR